MTAPATNVWLSKAFLFGVRDGRLLSDAKASIKIIAIKASRGQNSNYMACIFAQPFSKFKYQVATLFFSFDFFSFLIYFIFIF